ncbi:LytTR family transcriptional regulator DNA-binding domain-containing protein [Arsenicibacter rosenii]|uniref:HTH LytTR-type domain-containing protein n=1 Tax=Arsenicibacter rosenii TaxID=1750698 RepID=A0A1S2VNA1_9BACT|nr:LytTR family transcriptional regulator DNA-binding domain-containing protein [Arsenicibacter rosenii]OIN60251.1 hypothetical protein BLX24_05310 [Arsenicibacter rosenii]
MSFINDVIRHPVLISHLSGANNYTWVHFRAASKLLISKPLRYFEERFPEFIRLHKVVLANPTCIKKVIPPPTLKKSGAVELEDGTRLPISRRRWKEISDAITTAGQETELTKDAPVIMFVTGDRNKGLLLQQFIETTYSPYHVHIMPQANLVCGLLNEVPATDLPVLIILDTRLSFQESLSVVRQLKSNKHTSFLPVVVLVREDEKEGVYHHFLHYANSVISVPEQNTTFVETIKWLCEYWLRFNRLPNQVILEEWGMVS